MVLRLAREAHHVPRRFAGQVQCLPRFPDFMTLAEHMEARAGRIRRASRCTPRLIILAPRRNPPSAAHRSIYSASVVHSEKASRCALTPLRNQNPWIVPLIAPSITASPPAQLLPGIRNA